MLQRDATLSDLLAGAASGAGAVRYGGTAIPYREIAMRTSHVARALARLGIGRGDRVALWLPNTPAWLELLFALGRIGAVAVAVNTRFRAVEVADIVHRSRCRALVLWPGFKGIDFAGILEGIDPAALDRLEAVISYDEGETPPRRPLHRVRARALRYADLAAGGGAGGATGGEGGDAEAGAAIFTTSGTTKSPKFVLHTQRSLVDHARAVSDAFGYGAPDAVMFQALPFCGVFGLSQALATIAAGRPMVLTPVFEAETATRLIAAERATHINGSDEMYRRLLEAAPGAVPFPLLRRAGFAAFNDDPAAFVALADSRGLRASGLYGMSEVQALFAAQSPAAPAAQRALAGGVPVSAAAAFRARDPDTGEILPHGAPGELELRGPSLMREYADDPAATAAAMTADGFLRTGDLGYTAPDGFVFLARMGDALRLGGYLVNPLEIAGHLEAHPGVAACQVVGVKTPRGERAVAFVVKRPAMPADAEALATHCRAGLAAFKCPAAFVFLDAFPVAESANGLKIQRARLRAWAAERLDA